MNCSHMSAACDPKTFSPSRISAELARAERVSNMLSDPTDVMKIQDYIQELIAATERMQHGAGLTGR